MRRSPSHNTNSKNALKQCQCNQYTAPKGVGLVFLLACLFNLPKFLETFRSAHQVPEEMPHHPLVTKAIPRDLTENNNQDPVDVAGAAEEESPLDQAADDGESETTDSNWKDDDKEEGDKEESGVAAEGDLETEESKEVAEENSVQENGKIQNQAHLDPPKGDEQLVRDYQGNGNNVSLPITEEEIVPENNNKRQNQHNPSQDTSEEETTGQQAVENHNPQEKKMRRRRRRKGGGMVAVIDQPNPTAETATNEKETQETEEEEEDGDAENDNKRQNQDNPSPDISKEELTEQQAGVPVENENPQEKKKKRRKGRRKGGGMVAVVDEPDPTAETATNEKETQATGEEEEEKEAQATEEEEGDAEEEMESNPLEIDTDEPPPPPQLPADAKTLILPTIQLPEEVESLIQQVMEERNLTVWNNSATIYNTLRHVWWKDNSYDKQNDFIVFFHPMKSGGTSVSAILDKVGGVLPGSHESGHFNFQRWRTQYEKDRMSSGITQEEWWAPQKVIYSHHQYRRPSPPNYHTPEGHAQNLYRLVKRESTKRARHITMLREPLAFVASNMNEWICKNSKFVRKATLYNWPTSNASTACYGYTLQDLAQVRIQSNTFECENSTKADLKRKKMKRRGICKVFQRGKKDDTPYCRSATDFMTTFSYREKVLEHMSHYPRGIHPNIPIQDYVASTVLYLGGLDTMPMNNATNTTRHYGDMMWFGMPERMHESMCLLHYQLQIPFTTTPHRRVQGCRPTTFWTKEEQALFYAREPLAVHLHQAANAVLDIQLVKMKHEIRTHLQKMGIVNATNIHEFPYLPKECWMEADTLETAIK